MPSLSYNQRHNVAYTSSAQVDMKCSESASWLNLMAANKRGAKETASEWSWACVYVRVLVCASIWMCQNSKQSKAEIELNPYHTGYTRHTAEVSFVFRFNMAIVMFDVGCVWCIALRQPKWCCVVFLFVFFVYQTSEWVQFKWKIRKAKKIDTTQQ